MITVGMNYDVIEGKQGEFEKVFAKVHDIMKQMEGHGESHLFLEVGTPSSYLIISEWSDETAFDAFISSEQFKSVVDWGKAQILSARPKHEIYGRGDVKAQSCPAHQ